MICQLRRSGRIDFRYSDTFYPLFLSCSVSFWTFVFYSKCVFDSIYHHLSCINLLLWSSIDRNFYRFTDERHTHTEKEGGRERLVTNYPNAEVKVELIDFWKSPLRLFGGSSGYRASFYGILMINGTLKPIKTFHSLKLSAKLNSTSKVLWIYTVLRWEPNGWRTRKVFSGIRKFMSIYHFKMTS